MSKRRRIFALLLTLALVSVAGVASLEILLRLFVPVTGQYWYFWDPALGPRIEPNHAGRHIRGNTLNARFHFNSQGWNHPDDYTTQKPPGARRVCIVGDSQVESLQVNPEQTMFAVAQRRMTRPDRPVQWYAFANSGWGTNMAYAAIRHYALDYNPDLVVLLFIQNDPFDCSPYIVALGDFNPVYYLDENDNLAFNLPASKWKPSRRARLASQSALFRYFMFQKQIYDKFLVAGTVRPGIGGLPLMAEGQTGEKCVVPGLASMSLTQRQAMTWKLIEKIFQACRDDCRHRGATFAVAFRGWTDEIEAPIRGPMPAPDPKDKDPYCLVTRFSEMGRECVGPICSKLDIPYLDLTNALRTTVAGSGKSHVFVDEHNVIVDNHYNALAHEAVGEAMAVWADSILESKSAPSSPTTANR